MLEIPGKACGSCSFCCKVLEIDELKKTAGDLCEHCARSGGCSVYATRPQVCRDYHLRLEGGSGTLGPVPPRPRGDAVDGRSRQRRISRRLRPGKAVFLAQSSDIQASRQSGEGGARRRRQGGFAQLAHLRGRTVARVGLIALILHDQSGSRAAFAPRWSRTRRIRDRRQVAPANVARRPRTC